MGWLVLFRFIYEYFEVYKDWEICLELYSCNVMDIVLEIRSWNFIICVCNMDVVFLWIFFIWG